MKTIEKLVLSYKDILIEVEDRLVKIENRLEKTPEAEKTTMEEEQDLKEYFTSTFPISTVDVFQAVEASLNQNAILYKYVVKRAKMLTAKDVKSSVYNICKVLITNSVACQFSWIGAKKKAKFCEYHKIVSILKEAIRSRQEFSDSTDFEIIEAIKNWLRLASTRLSRETNPVA